MGHTIRFGTDGWRGVIAEDFTFDNVRICAQALAGYLKEANIASKGMIVGYDTRFASEHFAAAVAEVFAGNSIKTYLCQKPTPTPVVSYNVVARGAAGAVVITASHNPAIWNGFKIKTAQGTSAPPEATAEIEKRLPGLLAGGLVKRVVLEEGLKQGTIETISAESVYLERLKQLIDMENIRNSPLKIVVDPMYGAAAGYFPMILSGGQAEVLEINPERNPIFPGINPEPIAPNLGKLSRQVKGQVASVGIATDGDGDRLGIVDEDGKVLTQPQIFALLILYLLEVKKERGAIVKTITSTRMAERLADLYQLPLYEVSVGFRHVAPTMARERAMIGGEESGGFAFRGHILDRDGILAGLSFLDLMVRLKKSPSQLISYLYEKVGTWHYQRIDLKVPEGKRDSIADTMRRQTHIGRKAVVKLNTMDGLHFSFADGSWLLCRLSGTEPLLRLYAEGTTEEETATLLAEARKLVSV